MVLLQWFIPSYMSHEISAYVFLNQNTLNHPWTTRSVVSMIASMPTSTNERPLRSGDRCRWCFTARFNWLRNNPLKSKARWWQLNFLYVQSYLRRWSNLANMFQMGWNHQPEGGFGTFWGWSLCHTCAIFSKDQMVQMVSWYFFAGILCSMCCFGGVRVGEIDELSLQLLFQNTMIRRGWHGWYMMITLTVWWQLKYFLFSPLPWGNDPIWRAYFSDGLETTN